MTKIINLSEHLLKLSDYQKKRIDHVCGECLQRFGCWVKDAVENDDYEDVRFRRRAMLLIELSTCPADPIYHDPKYY